MVTASQKLVFQELFCCSPTLCFAGAMVRSQSNVTDLEFGSNLLIISAYFDALNTNTFSLSDYKCELLSYWTDGKSPNRGSA